METGINDIEVYMVRWWGTEGSEMGRPIYGIIKIDNGRIEIRHGILEGRSLGDYTLPYWPVRSFLAIVNRPAELAHRGYARFSLSGEPETVSLVCGNPRYNHSLLCQKRIEEGFELATMGEADVLKVTNRGSGSPLLIEHFFVVTRGSPEVQILARATNTSGQPMRGLVLQTIYGQEFNWSDFGVGDGGSYRFVEAPGSGEVLAFFAFSSGMNRGYEFIAGEGCDLSYTLSPEMNRWEVKLSSTEVELDPDASVSFQYIVRVLDAVPSRPHRSELVPAGTLMDLPLRRIKPTTFKPAPVRSDGRVMLPQLVRNLRRPKVRGLNLRAGFPQALRDLETLRDWGCNLVIIGIGSPEQTKQIIERGHELGMEVFIQGSGSYNDGPPRFDRLYKEQLTGDQQPDSYGQDEDHYYWYGVRPERDFEADFGKPMHEATREEMVLYWSRCFADKWRGVLEEARRHNPKGGIWFYTPSPGIANVDPLDYYDIFLREVAGLGDALTVFPFYYGIEYSQAEYMVRRWKDAGARRVVFLPMRGFMTRPSQFFRAITAARRGRADGVCGFSFPVGAEMPGKSWQWKAVMLAAQANFPTPELDAYCFIEEPAELVEALAASDVDVLSDGVDVGEFILSLDGLLPGRVRAVDGIPERPPQDRLYVVVGDTAVSGRDSWARGVRWEDLGPHKGIVRMRGNIVSLHGTDAEGIANAMKLFARFAELARAERGG